MEQKEHGSDAAWAEHGPHAERVYDRIGRHYGLSEDETWKGNRDAECRELARHYGGCDLRYAKEGEDIAGEVCRYGGAKLKGKEKPISLLIGKPRGLTTDARQKESEVSFDLEKAKRLVKEPPRGGAAEEA